MNDIGNPTLSLNDIFGKYPLNISAHIFVKLREKYPDLSPLDNSIQFDIVEISNIVWKYQSSGYGQLQKMCMLIDGQLGVPII